MDSAETRRLLVEHYLDFYGQALSMLADEDDAKDVVQEAVVRTLTRINVGNPVGYCMQAVRRLAIDTLRHRAKRMPLPTDEVVATEEGRDHELLLLVARLRRELPRAMREMVTLHDQKGYTLDEIASLTGVSKMTVRRRLQEAHRIMKEEIEKRYNE